MNKFKAISFLIGILAGTCVTQALAFPICSTNLSNFAQVSERYDPRTDRFFLQWAEQVPQLGACMYPFVGEPIDPATVPTLLQWSTWTSTQCSIASLCESARRLCRFRNDATPQPASMFFTISEGECELLKRPGSGWTFIPDRVPDSTQGLPRLVAFRPDPVTGQCPGDTVPVHRFYNNRSDEGLSNHRFVADEAVRIEMRGRARWVEEGVAFCVLNQGRQAYVLQSQVFLPFSIPPTYCNGGSDAQFGTCVVAVNMPVPTVISGPFQTPTFAGSPQPPGLFERTGSVTGYLATLGNRAPGDLSAGSFVQFQTLLGASRSAGYFVTSSDRTAGNVSGLALRSFVNGTASNLPSAAPFQAVPDPEVALDLAISLQSFVKRIRTTGELSQAFAFSELVFVDAVSNKKIELNLFAFGTPSVGDFVGAYPDGNVLAVFALGPDMTFGRSVGLPMLQTARTFDSINGWGYGGDFAYRVNRQEFARFLQRARVAQPLLSADPRDYRIDTFSFKGQVAGTAEIGYNVQKHDLAIVRP